MPVTVLKLKQRHFYASDQWSFLMYPITEKIKTSIIMVSPLCSISMYYIVVIIYRPTPETQNNLFHCLY